MLRINTLASEQSIDFGFKKKGISYTISLKEVIREHNIVKAAAETIIAVVVVDIA